ncbi:MAG TPA: hypothetical protein VLZ30_03600 [Verrucomicrobiae bacterium]|nr:hypothetical protein [Verrucomicrobiae bacterium]
MKHRLTWLAPFVMVFGIWAQRPTHRASRPVGDGGAATNAEINGPHGIATDGAKSLYIIEGIGNFIRCVDLNTGLISTIKPKVKLEAMDKIVVDKAGDLIVSEFTADRIRKIHPQNGSVSSVAGAARISFAGDGGPSEAAGLSRPSGMALDANGNLYIVDMDNNRIRRIDNRTGIISTVAGSGKRDSSGDGGPAVLAGLEYPSGVAIDSANNIYISQFGYGPDSHRVRRVDAKTGLIETIAGAGKVGLRGDGGLALPASLQSPSGLAFDRAGNLFVVDPVNDRVRRIDGRSGIISTFAGTTKGFAGDGGPAANAKLNNPSGIAFDSDGNLYIAEFVNNRVRRVDAKTGIITTIAGNGLPNRTDVLM